MVGLHIFISVGNDWLANRPFSAVCLDTPLFRYRLYYFYLCFYILRVAVAEEGVTE